MNSPVIGKIDGHKKTIIISSITVHKVAILVNRIALIVHRLIQTVIYASAFRNQFRIERYGLWKALSFIGNKIGFCGFCSALLFPCPCLVALHAVCVNLFYIDSRKL